jgi:hypothetical protein
LLPSREIEILSPHLEYQGLRVGEVLHAADRAVPFAYFPTTAIVSLSKILRSGATVELASVGREGRRWPFAPGGT